MSDSKATAIIDAMMKKDYFSQWLGIERLEENAAAADITLSKGELQNIEAVIKRYPNVGQRYSDGALKMVNQ